MTGVAYGTQRSLRRGQGAEIAGTRPYRPGDRLAWIDWYASARQSMVQDEDAFVVREYYAELAPRVIIVADRRPSMALYSADLPWLAKHDVLREATTAIVAAAHAARAYVGYLDFSSAGSERGDVLPHWLAPHRQNEGLIWRRLGQVFDAPVNSLALEIDYLLGQRRDVPAGSFVFVISDFLQPPPAQLWSRVRARGWDLVPVIVQDRVWEQSFPAVQGLLVPVTDPEDGTTAAVRLTAREADERRAANEARLRDLVTGFQRLQFDPVLLDTSDPATIDLKFITWATRRRLTRGPRQ
jgi:uncharacterized protein (DUF58 family)